VELVVEAALGWIAPSLGEYRGGNGTRYEHVADVQFAKGGQVAPGVRPAAGSRLRQAQNPDLVGRCRPRIGGDERARLQVLLHPVVCDHTRVGTYERPGFADRPDEWNHEMEKRYGGGGKGGPRPRA